VARRCQCRASTPVRGIECARHFESDARRPTGLRRADSLPPHKVHCRILAPISAASTVLSRNCSLVADVGIANLAIRGDALRIELDLEFHIRRRTRAPS
jgi:hypothetical protein